MANEEMSLIFERSKPGRIAYSLPEMDVPEVDAAGLFPPEYIRKQDVATVGLSAGISEPLMIFKTCLSEDFSPDVEPPSFLPSSVVEHAARLDPAIVSAPTSASAFFFSIK